MSDENDELVQEFLIESYENLDQLDRDFVELEQHPGDRERLGGIFRTIHTIKGTSGFLAFGKLEKVTHVGENLLSRLRDGSLDLSEEITSALLAMVDAVREMLANIEERGAEGDTDYSDLVDTLRRLNEGEAAAATADGSAQDAAAAPSAEAAPEATAADDVGSGNEAAEEAAADTGAEPAVVAGPEAGAADSVAEPSAGAPGGQPAEKAAAASSAPAARSSIAETSIRVDVGQLDRLMNLVGELVLARNQILQHSAALTDAGFLATCQRLNLITTELQEGVMKTRMQPIGNVWSKFPRVVRDLATAAQKQVKVEMEGKQTEVDKTILESIKDPLTHIVRNSCDHGLEQPEERIAAGKPAEGTLRLRAYHEGGQVNIEVSDDGRGIDPQKVKAKAIEKGVVTRQQADQLSDRDLVNLVFAAGFSTAEQVTNVSGRGVGMDVVRTNIEKIGGTVDIHNTPGKGATLKVKIPLTLAIIPALIVTTRTERYAIPQVSLLELVRLEGDDIEASIEHVHGAPVYRLRGNLLPLVYLDKELQLRAAAAQPALEAESADPVEAGSDESGADDQAETAIGAGDEEPEGSKLDRAVNIVVLQAADRSFGLVVDDVNDTEEIVVKPLGAQLKSISAFAGATIMGDGRVALILDVMGLAQNAKVVAEAGHGTVGDADSVDEGVDDRQMLLVCGVGEERRVAIPLSLVGRLEEVDPKSIENAAGRPVIQYREQIMPLVFLTELLGVSPRAGEDSLHVVVYDANGRSVGLVVDEILDVVEADLRVENCADAHGLAGAAVVQGAVTDLVDVKAIVEQSLPAIFAERLVGEA